MNEQKKFIITIIETQEYECTISAETEKLARNHVERLYKQGRIPLKYELQHTKTIIKKIR